MLRCRRLVKIDCSSQSLTQCGIWGREKLLALHDCTTFLDLPPRRVRKEGMELKESV
jgi:hypothetical protein